MDILPETKAVTLAYCDLKGKGPMQASVLELLFARGLLSPQTRTHCWTARFKNPSDNYSHKMTVWQHSLVYIYLSRQTDRGCASLLEAFLRYKPNLDFSFKFTRDRDEPYRRRGSLGFGQDQGNFDVGFPSWAPDSFEVPSPRSWIEQSSMENKEKLLQMIDAQLKEEECKEKIATAGDLGQVSSDDGNGQQLSHSLSEKHNVLNKQDKYLVLGRMKQISTYLLVLLLGMLLTIDPP
jgi:hypothetical protein